MVFCYKLITASPRRCDTALPSSRKGSVADRLPNITSSISQLIRMLDYETCDSQDILSTVPEREWRLLATLSRKRQEDVEREKLADQFRKMWDRERLERETVAVETSNQYKRYLNKKREHERLWHEFRILQRDKAQQLRREELVSCIQYKHRRSQDMQAWINDQKTNNLIDKALEEDTRLLLAADRRSRIEEAEEWRKKLDLMDVEQRVETARKRRSAILRDTSKRVAITNALSSWESSLLQHDVTAMDAAKRASHAARVALTDERYQILKRNRELRQRRAKRVAVLTEMLRDLVKQGPN